MKPCTRNQGRKTNSRYCYACEETEHITRNCPQRKDKVEDTGKGGNAQTLVVKPVSATSMSANPCIAVTKSTPEGFESWNADSDVPKRMTPDAAFLIDYKPAAPEDMVEVTEQTLVPVQRCDGLKRKLQQPGGITVVTLQNVTHVPALGHSLLSTRRASVRSGGPFINYSNKTQFDLEKNAICTFRLVESGLFEVLGRRCNKTGNKALSLKVLLLRGVMAHRLFGHHSEQTTREMVNQLGVGLSGPWTPCVACSKEKARRNAVPTSTGTRSTHRAGRFFVEPGCSMPATRLGGSKCARVRADDVSRFKAIRVLNKKSDATAALRNIIAENIMPVRSKFGFIRTDEGGEFEG